MAKQFASLSLHSLTKGRSSDGFFLNVEDLIRQAIKEFDYLECTIFKQLVQTIAPVEKVSVLDVFLGMIIERENGNKKDVEGEIAL